MKLHHMLSTVSCFCIILSSTSTQLKCSDRNKTIPKIGFGSSNVYDADVIESAIEVGYRMIDTGLLYGNHRQIASALKRSGVNRSDIFLITKVGFFPGGMNALGRWLLGVDDERRGGGTNVKGDEERALSLSLAELQTDYADLCLIHSPFTNFWEFLLAYLPHRIGRRAPLHIIPRWMTYPASSILRTMAWMFSDASVGFDSRRKAWLALEAAQRSGRCKLIGVSNYALGLLKEMESYSSRLPDVNEVEMHPMFHNAGAVEYCQARQISLIGYGNGIALGDKTVAAIGIAQDRTPSQVLLQWNLNKGASVIPKTTNTTRLIENFRASEVNLTAHQLSLLDDLNTAIPYYWDTTFIPGYELVNS